VPEIVRQGENGLLVPPGSAGALSEALARLVDDSELRRRMGRNGRALVERELTVDVEVGRTQEVYDRVLRERGRR
jgi:glycosyltransferase involved in cell wall biosynthesis